MKNTFENDNTSAEINEQAELSQKVQDAELITTDTQEGYSCKESDNESTVDITFANCTVSELYELANKYPNENIAEDILSEPFKVFSKQRTGTAKEIYADYLELKHSFTDTKQPARGLSGQENSNRAYSGYAKTAVRRDVSCGLTARQMQIARESGMSYREYSDLLSSVPHGRNL